MPGRWRAASRAEATIDRAGESRPAGARAEATIDQAGERRSARIESLRALAALAVLADHAWGFTNVADFRTFHSRVILGAGFIGVDLFFALTGYLIFLPFARRDYGGGRRVELRGYARNRALRVLPLYYGVLIVLVVVDGAAPATFARFAVFGENFRESTVATTLDGPMWSLVVEVFFYLLLPLLAWLLARVSRGSPARAAVCLLALAGASVALDEAGLHPARVWTYSLPTNFFFFVPGMLLALLRASRERTLADWSAHPLARSDIWLGAAVVLWLAIFAFPSLEFRLLPLAAIGSLLALAATVLPMRHHRVGAVLNSRGLAAVGVASYSLYLWHWPILDWLPHPSLHGYGGWLVFLAYALPLCLAAAALSYRVIEAPPLRLRRRWFAGSTVGGPAPGAPAAAGVVLR